MYAVACTVPTRTRVTVQIVCPIHRSMGTNDKMRRVIMWYIAAQRNTSEVACLIERKSIRAETATLEIADTQNLPYPSSWQYVTNPGGCSGAF